MTNAPYIILSKLEVAKRQLETSILLFFKNQDVVSIHALAYAAHEVLSQLGKAQGHRSFIKDDLINMIKPEKRDEINKMLSEAANFFKHSGKDKGENLKFYIRPTEYVIWDAARIYMAITNERPPTFSAYTLWFYLTFPEVINDSRYQELLSSLSRNYDPKDRSQFIQAISHFAAI